MNNSYAMKCTNLKFCNSLRLGSQWMLFCDPLYKRFKTFLASQKVSFVVLLLTTLCYITPSQLQGLISFTVE